MGIPKASQKLNATIMRLGRGFGKDFPQKADERGIRGPNGGCMCQSGRPSARRAPYSCSFEAATPSSMALLHSSSMRRAVSSGVVSPMSRSWMQR